MDLFKPKMTKRDGPESKIQDAIIDMLKLKDWHIESTHGNMYQHGFPDLYCMHLRYGTRWIEVKNPVKYSFTPAQLEKFPMFTAKGVGIWILTAATESQYQLLFGSPNWYTFLSVFR